MYAWADAKKPTNTVLLLLLLIAGGFAFRSVFAEVVMPPTARMQGETTQAYRYTKMVSSGIGVPAVDTLVMQPTGMRTSENSIFEEYLAGGIHRLIGGDLTDFLTIFCRLFPLLVMPVMFFWMYHTGFSFLESFTGAGLYAVFLPALLRTRGESLYRETVALPLIVLTLALVDSGIRNKRSNALKFSIPAAGVFFAALAAWKVTGFVSFFLFAWMAFRRPGRRHVVPLVVAQLLASVLLTHMRHDAALFSPGTVMALAALASSFFNLKSLPWIGFAASAAAALAAGSPSSGHVASVIVAKLRFFFSHPSDPLMLSDDARLFWVSGYTSPLPGQIVWLFGLSFLVAVFGWKTFREKTSGSLMLFLVPLSAAGYLFFERLHVFLAVAMVAPVVAASARKRWLLPVIMAAFGIQTMYSPRIALLLSDHGMPFRNSASLLTDRELDDLIDWAKSSSGTVLSFWHISGLLSAYSETPVVTGTFFENSENRHTIVEYARKMYANEDEMVDFMESKNAEYLVYQADFIYDRTPEGLLYLAGLTGIPDGSLAVRLHYYPESLERLKLVWQGPSLRVFKLDGEGVELPRQVLWEPRYGGFIRDRDVAGAVVNNPIETGIYFANKGFEENNSEKLSAGLLLLAQNHGEVPADAATGILQKLLTENLAGRYPIDELEQDFVTYLDSWGPDPELRLDLVRLLRNNGLFERADHHMMIIQRMGRSGT